MQGGAQMRHAGERRRARSANADARRRRLASAWDFDETGRRPRRHRRHRAGDQSASGTRGGGELLLQPIEHDREPEIELLSIDRGPGMDMERCMRDGYSTGGTPAPGSAPCAPVGDSSTCILSPTAGTVVLSRGDGCAIAGLRRGAAGGARVRRDLRSPCAARSSAATPGASPRTAGNARCWSSTASATARWRRAAAAAAADAFAERPFAAAGETMRAPAPCASPARAAQPRPAPLLDRAGARMSVRRRRQHRRRTDRDAQTSQRPDLAQRHARRLGRAHAAVRRIAWPAHGAPHHAFRWPLRPLVAGRLPGSSPSGIRP